MMRLLMVMTIYIGSACVLAAKTYLCSSPLILPANHSALPEPSIEFTLTLKDTEQFVGEGTRIGDNDQRLPFAWQGHWIFASAQIAMIGQSDIGELRAFSTRATERVLMFELAVPHGPVAMIRCLPKEAA